MVDDLYIIILKFTCNAVRMFIIFVHLSHFGIGVVSLDSVLFTVHLSWQTCMYTLINNTIVNNG